MLSLANNLLHTTQFYSRTLISNFKRVINNNNNNCYYYFKSQHKYSTIISRKTCLYDLHVEHQGRIVDFAGWLLPVQYKEAIAVSHQHTRTQASLFDVGHMLQTIVWGKNSGEFLESLTTADLKNLKIGGATLTVFTNDNGGILDDLIITKDGDDRFYVVSNAGRRDADIDLFSQRKDEFDKRGRRVHLEYLDPLDQGLIALQGPMAAKVLQKLVDINLNTLLFMNSIETQIDKFNVRITRCGYTGEDGFEISIEGKYATDIVEMILENDEVKLAGLGARDSLRLEAGLCLYGHDINEETTPIEAGLTWLVAKRRREEANFPGVERILSQIEQGVRKKRIGLTINKGPPARENSSILDELGEKIGVVTSGGPSPTLGKSIAMGYVPTKYAKNGSNLLVQVRGKTWKATVTKMPFIKPNYYTGKK
ncbi:aminomethyltransferase, mitochondrial [Microplitis mediator]|uniref:aminomethyltransferase, mitochondrial n=1 Tax=Microplitis mediator TaxID=375433 RepID=UPI0025572983|nr:aminomethyltransferase, mitochondrial [Microplitis mediator]